jgi:hypothetical protein
VNGYHGVSLLRLDRRTIVFKLVAAPRAGAASRHILARPANGDAIGVAI